MLKYKIEKQHDKPLYESLYEVIRKDIISGRLKAGRRLPSKRDMADDNDISLTTVMNAYRQLQMEGYIISEEKKGYFVADIQRMQTEDEEKKEEISYYIEDEWFADFRSNNTLYHYFPYSTWKKVVRDVLTDYDLELVTRGNPFGIPQLRRQIADYLYRVRKINVSPECIVVGAGIEYLYGRLITMFNPNTIYAVENPGYQKIPDIYTLYNLRWKSVEMDDKGLSMADLIVKDADIVHVSPEHHYPLGTLMPVSRRQELLAWADEAEDRYIIEDDFDCEFRYNSRPVPPIKSMDTSGKVIYMNTISKTLSPAVRISYMVLPARLMQRYITTTHFFTNSTSSLEQYALARFIEKGYFERHISRIRKLYRQEGEKLWTILHENTAIPCISVSGVESGTHLLVKLDTRLTDGEIKRRARDRGVNIGFMSDFCSQPNPRYEHIMILNFSDLEEGIQREAVYRLGKIFSM